MILNERQLKIIELLKKEKRMSVSKLSQQFFVSEMTVRRDLRLLEEECYLSRYQGGALIKDGETSMPIKYRRLLHAKQKAKLAEKAKKYIRNSMNVFLDSSSTCAYLIPLLAEYDDIHIVTNSVPAVIAAAERGIRCTLAGGDYYKHDMCTVGSIAESFLHGINVDIDFFSSLGLSDDGIITDSDEQQNSARKIVMQNCNVNIFMFDDHKLHKKYLYTLCGTDEITDLIIL